VKQKIIANPMKQIIAIPVKQEKYCYSLEAKKYSYSLKTKTIVFCMK